MTALNKEYATALFMLAGENHARDEYAAGLQVVLSALQRQPAYVDFLASPGIPLRERLGALEDAFSAAVPEHVLSFVELLVERGRIRAMEGCVKEYRLLLDEFHRVSVARVRYSAPLTEMEQSRLRAKLEKLSGHSVQLVCEYDPSLLGGVVVEMDGKCMDGSLRRRLHEVKDVISR
ncbi:MAG: ATP synthase F1 subunit delta [Clostridia bacterium]|nr:ATP synthase F1 subunit delta [Clostridia bacterium]MBQ7339186.1 ATP synthase F1 subunit delta [Clostridia bacterium]